MVRTLALVVHAAFEKSSVPAAIVPIPEYTPSPLEALEYVFEVTGTIEPSWTEVAPTHKITVLGSRRPTTFGDYVALLSYGRLKLYSCAGIGFSAVDAIPGCDDARIRSILAGAQA